MDVVGLPAGPPGHQSYSSTEEFNQEVQETWAILQNSWEYIDILREYKDRSGSLAHSSAESVPQRTPVSSGRNPGTPAKVPQGPVPSKLVTSPRQPTPKTGIRKAGSPIDTSPGKAPETPRQMTRQARPSSAGPRRSGQVVGTGLSQARPKALPGASQRPSSGLRSGPDLSLTASGLRDTYESEMEDSPKRAFSAVLISTADVSSPPTSPPLASQIPPLELKSPTPLTATVRSSSGGLGASPGPGPTRPISPRGQEHHAVQEVRSPVSTSQSVAKRVPKSPPVSPALVPRKDVLRSQGLSEDGRFSATSASSGGAATKRQPKSPPVSPRQVTRKDSKEKKPSEISELLDVLAKSGDGGVRNQALLKVRRMLNGKQKEEEGRLHEVEAKLVELEEQNKGLALEIQRLQSQAPAAPTALPTVTYRPMPQLFTPRSPLLSTPVTPVVAAISSSRPAVPHAPVQVLTSLAPGLYSHPVQQPYLGQSLHRPPVVYMLSHPHPQLHPYPQPLPGMLQPPYSRPWSPLSVTRR